ncbi:hypothetical protein [Actinoplanes awajinensis]|uniref:HEAT repeat domain-containing protein n=1 Tax=Actinoplanes awajinensis subsp. mycoplanecinus TaxID=135947 RepID=A0A101JFV5_9ACTN|nr:hypothetical protein [Actinoplanes awajinensis]KUL25716.1 hypothetical protein ADL15_40250 [Actinoplanes awajinensis subsp. mycoplanecinus]
MIGDLWVQDAERRGVAYRALLAESEQPVSWAGEVWDDVVAHLGDHDNHVRSIAAQLLCNLAAHDTSGRILGDDLEALLTVTKDPRFVTARHSLRSLWRIGLAGGVQRRVLLDVITQRYQDSFAEKNGTLVRSDLVETLRTLHDATSDEAVRTTATALIAAEPDEKYRRKYARHWR